MTPDIDLAVNIGRMTLRNPVMTGSGTFGSGKEFSNFVDLSRLGALVTKAVSAKPRAGNDSPRMAETASGMLNSIGLQNPGVEAFVTGDLFWLAEQDVPVIVNVAGHSVEEYVEVVDRLESVGCVAGYELNVSCPNVDEGGMLFGQSCETAAAVTSAVRARTERELIVKLTPNVTDVTEIAKAVADAGADALSLINTLLAMAIDVDTRKPKLARVVGGLSGPAVKPVAVRMVWQVANSVEVPVIGMGGIMDGRDAVEFMLAGASAVAVGTANFVEPAATTRVLDGIVEYCHEKGVRRVSELTGAMQA